MHHKTDIDQFMKECSKTNSFAELVPLAIAELQKFSDGSEVVCGPISTGGRGNIETNFKVFSASIAKLQNQNRPIFSQIPYEERIFFFRERWQSSNPAHKEQYYMEILEEFYHPLFQTGLIKKGWFIPGWESSFGARWERNQLSQLGAEIEDFTETWVDDVLESL